MEDGTQSVSLEVHLGLEGLVGVDGSGAVEPCAHAVVVQIVGELLDDLLGITNDLGIDDLDAGDGGSWETLGLGRSQGCCAERQDGDNAGDLHFCKRWAG